MKKFLTFTFAAMSGVCFAGGIAVLSGGQKLPPRRKRRRSNGRA